MGRSQRKKNHPKLDETGYTLEYTHATMVKSQLACSDCRGAEVFVLKPNGVFATMFTSLKHVINTTNRVSAACLGSVPTSARVSVGENHSWA